MCLGGVVVVVVLEDGRFVFNGMSYYVRNLENVNLVLVVIVLLEDFEGILLFRGMEF